MDKGLISVNGTIYPSDQAQIPAMDRGLLFGDNVFEVLVGFQNRLLDVQAHLMRLRQSAEGLEIPVPWSDGELKFEMESMAEQIDADKKYIRLVITRGSGLSLKPTSDLEPNRFCYAFPAKQEAPEVHTHGLALKLRRSVIMERGASPKTGNYLRSIVALRQAANEGFQDILWSNAKGEITEASTANVFFLGREGDALEVATPHLQSGLLSGITRSTLIRLLTDAKIPVTQRVIFDDELPKFDEAFMCSTVRGIVPINRIDRHRLHTGRSNAIFIQIKRLFNAWITSQLDYPVDWNTGRVLIP